MKICPQNLQGFEHCLVNDVKSQELDVKGGEHSQNGYLLIVHDFRLFNLNGLLVLASFMSPQTLVCTCDHVQVNVGEAMDSGHECKLICCA